MKNATISCLVILFYSLISCHTQEKTIDNSISSPTKPTEEESSIQDKNPILQYFKYPCRGFCKSFEFILYPSGEAIYIGIKNVEKIGIHYSAISPEAQKEILNIIAQLPSTTQKTIDYTNPSLVDMPNIKIQTKKTTYIFPVHGKDTPPILIESTEKLDRIIDSTAWEKMPE